MYKRVNISILGVLSVFLLTLFGGFAIPVTQVHAEKSSNDYSDVTKPSDDKPRGIWVDRATILVFNITSSDGKKSSKIFKNDTSSKGLGKGTNKFIGNGSSLNVVYAERDSKPTSGTLDGTQITLVKTDNAILDGYYENASFTLFRYLSDAGVCGNTQSNPDYADNGTFTRNKDGNWTLGGNRDGYPPVIDNIEKISDKKYKFNQKDTCDETFTDNETRSYSGPGESSGASKLYASIGTNQGASLRAAQARAESFNVEAEKLDGFEEYFKDPNSNQSKVLQGCGEKFAPGSTRAELIAMLSRGETGPFLDCMNAYLKDDPKFAEILSTTDESDYSIPDTSDDADECMLKIPFIGDLVCKMVKMIFDGISSMFVKVIDYFGGTGDTFGRLTNDQVFQKSQEAVRNIANIIFIFAFMVVIFQYLTNLNVVDAYFVKKFLPRLLVAVVLVQASWWIVKEMNFIATDLGGSARTIILEGATSSDESRTISISSGDGAVANLASGALVGFAFLGPGAPIVALIVAGILLLVLLACIILLAVREVLLVMLAIFAPLAFASMAIPQLESFMKKWLKAYIKILMIYPMMQVFLTLGIIVGNALNAMGGIYELFGFVAFFIPFFILPFTLKFAGGIMGNVSAKLGNLGKRGVNLGKDQGKKAYGRSNFAQDRAAKKSWKDSERGEAARRRNTARIAMTPPGGKLGRFGKPVSDEQRALAKAQMAQDDLRVESAQEQAHRAERAGHTLNVQQFSRDKQAELIGQSYVDSSGVTRTHDADSARKQTLKELEDRALETDANGNFARSDQEYFAIMQELGRQKADGSIGRVQDRLAQHGKAGADRWNAGVADNEVFGATTALNKGFGQSINPGQNHTEVASIRLNTALGKNIEARAGDAKGAWEESAHAAVNYTATSEDDHKYIAARTAAGRSAAEAADDLRQQKVDQLFADFDKISSNSNLSGSLNIDRADLVKAAAAAKSGGGSKYAPPPP